MVTIEGLFLHNPTLSQDGKILTLTSMNQADASGATVKAINVTNAKVTVNQVESKDDANVKTKQYVDLMTYKDTVAPTVSSERVSATQVKVKFSEPVVFSTGALSAKYADTTLTLVDTKITDGSTALPSIQSTTAAPVKELTLNLADADIEKDKDIVVTLNGIKDIAGNLINPQPSKITVVKKAGDTVAPKLNSVTQTGAKTFNIKFDKDIQASEIVATDNSTVTVTGGTVQKVEKVTNSEYKVTSDTVLEGIQTVTVVANKAVNMDGTKAAALTKTLTFVKDEVAPKATVKQVKDTNNKQVLQLTFDKDVELTGSKEVNITGKYVKDYVTTDLVSVPAATAVYADGTGNNKKVVNVPLATNVDATKNLAVEGAVYTLKLTSTDVESKAGVDMADVTTSFTRGEDGVAANIAVIEAADIAFAQGSNPDEVTVTFSNLSGNKLDASTASNIANYSIDGAVIESATVASESSGSQVVTLKLKANSNTFTGVRNATVRNVKIAGSTKVMDPVTKLTPSLKENVRPSIQQAKLTANDKIEITFSEAMAAVDMKEAFLVKAGTEVLNTKTTAATASGNKLVLTIETALTQEQLAKTITIETVKKADGSVDTAKFDVVKDANGNKLEAFGPTTVVKP